MNKIDRLFKLMNSGIEDWHIVREQFCALDKDVQDCVLDRWWVSSEPEYSGHFTACMRDVLFERSAK